MARVDRFVLLALVLLNAGLKLCWLGVNELSGDEPFTVFWSQQKTSDLLAMFQEENNPPLYFFLIKWWSAVTPYEIQWLRVPSAVFSALAVWPLFLLARRHAGVWTTAAACLLFTFCNEHYTYAHEVRAYSLLTLLTISGMWQADRLVRGAPRAGLWLVLVNTALVYTHFMGWAAIGIQFLCTLLVPEWLGAHKRWFKAVLITSVLFVPYGWVFAQRVGTSVAQGTWLTAPAWDEPYSMLWRWSNAPVITVAFIAVVVAGLWKSKVKGVLEKVALLWCGVPLVGLFLFSFVVPLYLDRYLVWAAPGFAVLVAVCVAHLGKEAVVKAGLVAACTAMLVTFVPSRESLDNPGLAVRQIETWTFEEEDPDEATGLIVLPYWYLLNFCFAADPSSYTGQHAMEVWNDSRKVGFGSVNGVKVDHSTCFLVDAEEQRWTRPGNVRAFLRSHYPRVDSVQTDPKVWVYRFRK